MSMVSSNVFLLLAADQVGRTTSHVAWDIPAGPWQWALNVGGFATALLLVLLVYLRDTATLHGFWKFWLTGLRVAVLVGLAVVAFNPHIRTVTKSIRPSRVALLLDISSSMGFPETQPSANTSPADADSGRTRTAAVVELLADSPLLEQLRRRHEVSVYTFDSQFTGPHHVFYPTSAESSRAEQSLIGQDAADFTTADNAIDWRLLLSPGPGGNETRLGESVMKLIDEIRGETLAGIVTITDGGSNAGVNVAAAHVRAKSSKVRLVAVGVGSTQKPVNLKVVDVRGPTDVHLGDAYELAVLVQGREMAGRTVKVELLAKPADDESVEPTLIEKREITLREDGVPVELKFERTPTVPGSIQFFVRACPTLKLREISDSDNEFQKRVNVVERNTAVLIVAGGPMRDYRFVRNMLSRHPAIDVDVWLQSVDPETVGQVTQDSDDLLIQFPEEFPTRPLAPQISESSKKPKRYDVVMAFDPDWSLMSPEQIQRLADWVGDLAGGLILVAGDVYTPELAAAEEEMQLIQELYPVFLNSVLIDFRDDDSDQAWQIQFTRAGTNIEFLQLTDQVAAAQDVWKEFEGVFRCYPTGGPKAGTTVYAEFSDPRTRTEYGQPILLASQFYKAGRVFYLGSAEIWRMRSLSDEYYDRFWTKLIREAGIGRLKQGTSRGTLLPQRSEYLIGQTVQVRAKLLDPQYEPLVQDSVDLQVIDPRGRNLVPPRRLFADQEQPGYYFGDFRASLAGKYTLLLPVPESKQSEKKTIVVKIPNLEFENPQQQSGLLHDLVRDTGGRYLPIEMAAKETPALLPDRSQPFEIEDRPQELWDRDWVLYLLVGLLSLEWLTRKLLKLA